MPDQEAAPAPVLYRVLRPVAVPLFEVYFRLDVVGKENVPKEGPVILAPVHRSYLDIPVIGMLTWRVVHFMAKAELWERSFSRWFCGQMGSFPVRRGSSDRAALQRALDILERGEVLALFPEGARQEGPTVQKVQSGVSYLAQKVGCPVVPIAITGTDRAMGLGASYPKPKKVQVMAGRPLDLRVPGERPSSRTTRLKANDVLRAELQRLYDGLRK